MTNFQLTTKRWKPSTNLPNLLVGPHRRLEVGRMIQKARVEFGSRIYSTAGDMNRPSRVRIGGITGHTQILTYRHDSWVGPEAAAR